MKTKDKAPSPTVKRRKETARMQVARSVPKGRPGRPAASVENEPQASSSVEDEPGQYEVEAIVNHKEHQRGGRKYFVKWKGYPEDQNTWEPVSSLLGCRDLLAEYDKSHAPETDAEQDAETAEESEYAGDGSEGYEVENVISFSDTDEGRYYMIKWKGWAGFYWEPEANLDSCPEILEKFWDERGGRPLKTANGQRRAEAANRGRPKAQNGVVKKKPVKSSKPTEKATKDSGEERVKRRIARERNGGRENSTRLDGHSGSHESQPKSSISQDGGRRANQMRQKREDTPQPTSLMKTRYVKNKEVLGDYLETAFGHDLSGSLKKKKRNQSESEGEDSPPPPKRRASKAAAEEEPVEDSETTDGYEAEEDRQKSPEQQRSGSPEVDEAPRKSHKEVDKAGPGHMTLKYSAYKKTVSLVTMDGVQFTGKRNILFNPDSVSDWSAWEYDASKLIDPEEKVHVIGRSISVKPELNFYMCVQGTFPDLICGITRKDMRKKFPKTMKWVDDGKMLTADNDDQDGEFSEEEELPMGFSYQSEGRAADSDAHGAPDYEREV